MSQPSKPLRRRPLRRGHLHRITTLERALARQRSEGAASLALLDALFATAPIGVAYVDRELRYVRINERLAESNGSPAAEHLGRSISEMLPQISPTLEQIYRQVLTTGAPVLDVEITGETPKAPGVTRTWVTSFYPVFGADSAVQGVGVVVEEITARKAAEARLRASEERFRAIVETSQDVILLTDVDSRLLYASPSSVRSLGYAPDELVGLLLRDLVHPEDLAAALAGSGTLLQAHGTVVSYTVRVRHRDGSWRWFRVTHNNQLDNPAFGAVIGSLHDITEQKLAEDAVADALRAERAARAELEASQARLRATGERLVAVQEEERRHLARELHDEIGQSLTALSLLLAMAPGLPPDLAAPRLADAHRQVGELIARVRQQSLDLRPGLLDDLGLPASLQWYVRRYSEQTGVGVDFAVSDLGGRLAPQIELTAYRTVQEALTNVARHSGAAEARVRVWAADERLLVQVEDYGCGMEAGAALAARASSGLVGMRERVALLGGEFTIDSEPGDGTRLLVDLPLHLDEAAVEAPRRRSR